MMDHSPNPPHPTDPANPFRVALGSQLAAWSIHPTDALVELCEKHFLAMMKTNRLHNLTRITDPGEAARQLYADSLALFAYLRAHSIRPHHCIDIGSGAGFPAFPLAVFVPDCHFTALEGRAKKARFMEECCRALGVSNLTAVHARAEDFKGDPVDLVTFKAVGSMADCLKIGRRLVHRQGRIVVYKSAVLDAEEEAGAQRAARELGLSEQPPWSYELCSERGPIQRACRVFVLS